MPPDAASATPSRRERVRAATIAEIKAVGLRLMRETGRTDLRFSDIARQMGMTAPGLYRYFGDSSELLTALIVDAYDDLGAVVGSARDEQPPEDVWRQVLATSRAYRDWARAEPERFALIFGIPVPGYCASDEGPTTEAAKRAMGQLQTVFLGASRLGQLGQPLMSGCDDAFIAGVNAAHDDDHLLPGAWNDDRAVVEDALTPVTVQAMLHFWVSLQGFVSLDAYGHFDWLGADAREALFVSTVRQAAKCAGLPYQ